MQGKRRKEGKEKEKIGQNLYFRHCGLFITLVAVWDCCSKEAKVFSSAVPEHSVYPTGPVFSWI